MENGCIFMIRIHNIYKRIPFKCEYFVIFANIQMIVHTCVHNLFYITQFDFPFYTINMKYYVCYIII